VGERALDLADAASGEVAHRLPHPVENLIQQVPMLLQIALTFRGDVVDLLALGILRPHVALVFQQLERGIDGAGRGGVAARHLLLQGLDDLVAVAGLLLEQPEDDEFDLTRLEHLGPAPGASASGVEHPSPHLAPKRESGPEAPVVSWVTHVLTSAMTRELAYDISYVIADPASRGRTGGTKPNVSS
jgi:hypothetical protein